MGKIIVPTRPGLLEQCKSLDCHELAHNRIICRTNEFKYRLLEWKLKWARTSLMRMRDTKNIGEYKLAERKVASLEAELAKLPYVKHWENLS